MYNLSLNEIRERLSKFSFPDFDLIIGIASGGIVPASLIAYLTGIDMRVIKINYRDEKNNPRYDSPRIFSSLEEEFNNKKLLIVDDVSVTGKTLEIAKSIFPGNELITFTFKGKADYVLFPEIKDCVNWPWSLQTKPALV